MENRTRKKQVLIRLSDSEYQILKNKAEISNYDMSSFLREILFSKSHLLVQVCLVYTDKRLNPLGKEFNGMRNNISQIKYQSYIKSAAYLREDILNLCNDYDMLLARFTDQLFCYRNDSKKRGWLYYGQVFSKMGGGLVSTAIKNHTAIPAFLAK